MHDYRNEFKERYVGVRIAHIQVSAENFFKHLSFIRAHTRERFACQHSRDLHGSAFFGDPKTGGGRFGYFLKDFRHNDVVSQSQLFKVCPHEVLVTLTCEIHY